MSLEMLKGPLQALLEVKSTMLELLPTLLPFGSPYEGGLVFCAFSFFLTTRHKAKAPYIE